jgi:hydroxyacylglutathione hydrolase
MAPNIQQLIAGRDFAKGDVIASQMANFVYIVADTESRQCVLVDPAWDVDGLLNIVDDQGLQLAGALVTHYHPDHVGGDLFGFKVKGIANLVAQRPVKVHVQQEEAQGVMKLTGLPRNDMVLHEGGDILQLGGTTITFLHTPGHTPGSQCFLVNSSLVSGDTLFINGCGRVDLPGGNAEQMYHSLTQVLAKLPDDTILYPGHNYSDEPSAPMGKVKRENYVLRMKDFSALG